jgi:hypothetical protein
MFRFGGLAIFTSRLLHSMESEVAPWGLSAPLEKASVRQKGVELTRLRNASCFAKATTGQVAEALQIIFFRAEKILISLDV